MCQIAEKSLEDPCGHFIENFVKKANFIYQKIGSRNKTNTGSFLPFEMKEHKSWPNLQFLLDFPYKKQNMNYLATTAEE